MKERKPNRLQGYNYSSDNLYFVTSCVQNRICCFGEIGVGTGRDLSLQTTDLPLQKTDLPPQNGNLSRPLSIRNDDQSVTSSVPQMILNEYGAIAEIQWFWLSEKYPYVILHEFVVMPNHIHGIIEINRDIVRTGRDLSLPQPKIKPLSELIGAYKTTVSKQIHILECRDRSRPVPTFAWQRSFYEHIIRDEKTFETISDYIINNPVNWEQNKLYN